MEETKMMYSCDLCGSKYQMGSGIYNGKYIKLYELNVCMPCYDGNWDGWNPHYEELIVAHLNKKGLPIPEKNAKGWLPRS